MSEPTKPFEMDEGEDDPKDTEAYERIVKRHAFNPRVYDINDRFNEAGEAYDPANKPHTTLELVAHLEANKDVQLEANVICKEVKGDRAGQVRHRKFDRDSFLEQFHKWKDEKVGFREWDNFSTDQDGTSGVGSNLLGHDFVPLLSGPFFKQLYYYDYLRMHALAFHAYHHDPVAKRCIDTILQFTLGRGFSVDFPDDSTQGDQALWEAWATANNLSQRFRKIALELLLFGEQFIWWLPDNAINITYQIRPGQESPTGVIPRIRQIDPSVIWEIVTYPEDIERVLYYQWVAPTQFQIYTGSDKGSVVPSTKFIYQQIPATDIMHFKVNCVSEEKRGRSILFNVLGDLKRLRDTLDFSIAGMQKCVAWSIDTEIEGSQADVDAYITAQQQLGTIPNAGSEFIHTSKIKREYLSNKTAEGGGNGDTFDWVLSKIAMGIGIPVNYLGGHQSGGTNRASAVVATEPVTKLFESFQLEYETIILAFAKKIGCKTVPEVTFPELVTQDRSAKLRDIMQSERAGYIAKSRAATMSAKELNITNYDWESETEDMQKEGPIDPNLLTTGGSAGGSPFGGGGSSPSNPAEDAAIGADEEPGKTKPSSLTGPEKRKISMRYGA